jgi:hypothetical protein
VGRRACSLQVQLNYTDTETHVLLNMFFRTYVSVSVCLLEYGYAFFDVTLSSQAAQAAKNTAPHKSSDPKKIDAVGAKGAPPPGKGAMVPS